eukprot:593125-Prymnesium_polylepis.2
MSHQFQLPGSLSPIHNVSVKVHRHVPHARVELLLLVRKEDRAATLALRDAPDAVSRHVIVHRLTFRLQPDHGCRARCTVGDVFPYSPLNTRSVETDSSTCTLLTRH